MNEIVGSNSSGGSPFDAIRRVLEDFELTRFGRYQHCEVTR